MTTSSHTLRVAGPAPTPAGDPAAGPRASLARVGEALAAHHLLHDDGLRVIARNWRLASGELRGELDLVAVGRSGGLLVVCEVKTRRSDTAFGGPLAAVTPAKQAKVRRLTRAFLAEGQVRAHRVRLDVIGIVVPGAADPVLHHVEGAF